MQNAILHRFFLRQEGMSDLMRPELFWKPHCWNMISPLRVKGLYDVPDSERPGTLSFIHHVTLNLELAVSMRGEFQIG